MTNLQESLPDIIATECSVEGVTLSLWVDGSLDYFNGHFPDAPVLAGVVQLDWAIKLARRYLTIADSDVKNIEVLKFQVVVTANSSLKLTLDKKNDHKFTFSYYSEQGQHASGRVVLASE